MARMVSLCSAHQDAQNDMYVDLEVMLRSPFDLDLMEASYTHFVAQQREDSDGVATLALAWLYFNSELERI